MPEERTIQAETPVQRETLVVKIGSAIVAPGGRLDPDVVTRIADDIRRARSMGWRVIVVSSGAVACGLAPLGLTRMPDRISDRQAAAAAGQPSLMRAWSRALEGCGLHAAQVLLTADDVDFRSRFVNARRTLETLLDRGLVPIVNENDSVSFDEIQLGDNDRLSALTAGLADASMLIILSAAPGLCVGGAGGRVLPVVEDITAAREHVSGDRTSTGVGGMATKLDAAEIARSMGVETVIAPGDEPSALVRILRGESIGTRFPAADEGLAVGALSGRKRWLAHAIRPRGAVVVDDGARRAVVERGASLLPGGVLLVEAFDPTGFGIGSAVEVRDGNGRVFARGLVSYRSDEIARIAGKRSAEIAAVLGYTLCDEVIHRDNLIVKP